MARQPSLDSERPIMAQSVRTPLPSSSSFSPAPTLPVAGTFHLLLRIA